MEIEEFLALLTAYTNKTTHLRAASLSWTVNGEQTLNTIASSIGRVVSLIQDRVNHNMLCKKEQEYLLIYNGEALWASTKDFYWSLNLVIKPLDQIDQTISTTGKTLQLVINGSTGEVMNTSKCLLDTELATATDIDWTSENAPVSYGYYHTYRAPCCFVAICNYRPIKDLENFFQGSYDKSMAVQQSQAFDTLQQASDCLAKKEGLGKYIAELPGAKENIEQLKKSGLGKETAIVIDCLRHAVVASAHTLDTKQPSALWEKLQRFKAAFAISGTSHISSVSSEQTTSFSPHISCSKP